MLNKSLNNTKYSPSSVDFVCLFVSANVTIKDSAGGTERDRELQRRCDVTFL